MSSQLLLPMIQPLFNLYTKYIENHQKRPESIRSFLGSVQEEGKIPFINFRKWEQEEMRLVLLKAKTLLSEDATFNEYTSREKVLAVFFTWLELLDEYRGFFESLHQIQSRSRTATIWNEVKPEFLAWIRSLIDEGISNREIANRPFLPQWYDNLIWAQATAILAFWMHDHSEEYAQTDALIEKSVNFIFDIIQPNALDSGWDLLSFLVKK